MLTYYVIGVLTLQREVAKVPHVNGGTGLVPRG